MIQGQADVGDGVAREGGEVPDGLHSGIKSPDFPERGRPGSEAQLRPLHVHGVPAQRLPKGAFLLPQATDAPTSQTARASKNNVGRHNIFRATECGEKARQTGSASQFGDSQKDVENHRQEGLREAGTREIPSTVKTDEKDDSGSTEVGKTEAGRYGRRRHGTALDKGPSFR